MNSPPLGVSFVVGDKYSSVACATWRQAASPLGRERSSLLPEMIKESFMGNSGWM